MSKAKRTPNRYARNVKRLCLICEYNKLKQEQLDYVLNGGKMPGRIKYFELVKGKKLEMIENAWSLKAIYPCSTECENTAWDIRNARFEQVKKDLEEAIQLERDALSIENTMLHMWRQAKEDFGEDSEIAMSAIKRLAKAKKFYDEKKEALKIAMLTRQKYHKPQKSKVWKKEEKEKKLRKNILVVENGEETSMYRIKQEQEGELTKVMKALDKIQGMTEEVKPEFESKVFTTDSRWPNLRKETQ